MPFLGRNSSSPLSGQNIDQSRIDMATAELDMVTDVFTLLRKVCYRKCIKPQYLDGELSKGESVCIDRCVLKFFEVNKKVGEKMQEMGASGQSGPAGSSQLSL